MGVSRRIVVQAGLGLTAVSAVPIVQHVAWGTRDYVRDDYAPDHPEPPIGEESWRNWSGAQTATPKQFRSPASAAELSEIIRTTPGRIRPRGSGHSFSGLVPSEGVILDVGQLAGLKAYDPVTQRATFGAGTVLFQAASQLNEIDRAFPNLPDIVDQTLAGSFSTATHGTGQTLTALHDYIHSFKLVTADGSLLNVTADSNPDLFSAGKVSLGALGVISEYTVETIPSFNLRRIVSAEPIDAVLDDAFSRASSYRNFEFYYLPGTGLAASITHDLHHGETTGLEPSNDDDEMLEGLKQLRNEFGWWPWLRKRIAQSALPSGTIEDVSDASLQLLATTRPIKFNEMEYHLPWDDGLKALRQIIKMMDQRKHVFFPMEVRFTAPDDAWLSPFLGGPRISIAIHAAVDEAYDYFFSEFEPVFKMYGGRPHWGKHHSLQRKDLEALYPDFTKFADLRRSLDPTGKFLNPHLADVFGVPFNA